MTYNFHITVLNGPNLNLLGYRETKKYGKISFIELIENLKKLANNLQIKFSHLQSNAEHILIDYLHQYKKNIDFIIINPGALAHTSIALRDAFLSIKIPFIEVHITNIYKREKFRQKSYLSDIATGVICGFGIDGYYCALEMAKKNFYIYNIIILKLWILKK